MSEHLSDNLTVECTCGCHIIKFQPSLWDVDDASCFLGIYELQPTRRMGFIKRLKHVYDTFTKGSLRCDLILDKESVICIKEFLGRNVKD